MKKVYITLVATKWLCLITFALILAPIMCGYSNINPLYSIIPYGAYIVSAILSSVFKEKYHNTDIKFLHKEKNQKIAELRVIEYKIGKQIIKGGGQ